MPLKWQRKMCEVVLCVTRCSISAIYVKVTSSIFYAENIVLLTCSLNVHAKIYDLRVMSTTPIFIIICKLLFTMFFLLIKFDIGETIMRICISNCFRIITSNILKSKFMSFKDGLSNV